MFAFYRGMSAKYQETEYDISYPVWGIFSEDRVKRGDWRSPDRFYYYNPAGHDQKPEGMYAIGYVRAGYGQGSELYERMLKFIAESGHEICGDTYEEYPINEVAVADDTDYLMRVMIPVRKK